MRIAGEIVDELRAAEADFDFCGMHVDVDFVVGHFEEEQRGGENVAGKNVAIGFVNGVRESGGRAPGGDLQRHRCRCDWGAGFPGAR